MRILLRIALISAVLNILMLGGSFFMLLVYDEVLPSRSLPTLVGLLAMIAIVYLLQALLDLVRGRAMIHVGGAVEQALRGRVFARLVDPAHAGEALEPVRDLDQVRAFLSGPGPLALLDLPWVFLFLGVLFVFHVALGLLASLGAIVLVVLALVTDRLTRARGVEASAIATSRIALADASQRNAEVLRALGMAGRAEDSWTEVSDRMLAANDRAAVLSGGMASVSRTFRMLLQSMVLATGAALVIGDKASGGIIIAGSILSSRALAPVDHSIAHWKGFVAARQAWARLEALIRAMPEPRVETVLPAPRATLAVEHLAAGAPGTEALAVAGIDFALAAGDVLGVIGPSGSGKTSLLRAITGVWPLARGAVRLDGAATDQWPRDMLGRHLGYLPQDVELFDGTVAANIARFDRTATQAGILAAARAAGVHDLIVRLPQGYDSPLGPQGNLLSAGQRQRIGLARALYGDPFLILLDEPNSNLDGDGEVALDAAIAAVAARGAIVVLVAHRRAILRRATHLLVMDEGRARLFGPRDAVMAKLRGPSAVRPLPQERQRA